MISTFEAVLFSVDTGLLVLTWLVQLLIYPSFAYLLNDRVNFNVWHEKHMSRITYVVLPLMLVQLVLGFLALWWFWSGWQIACALSVFVIWGLTVFVAVPLHGRLSRHADDHDGTRLLERLLRVHGIRTFLWTLVFLMRGWDLFF